MATYWILLQASVPTLSLIHICVALVKFLKWLEEAVPSGKETELSVDRKLHEFRAAQPLYMGESFEDVYKRQA